MMLLSYPLPNSQSAATTSWRERQDCLLRSAGTAASWADFAPATQRADIANEPAYLADAVASWTTTFATTC